MSTTPEPPDNWRLFSARQSDSAISRMRREAGDKLGRRTAWQPRSGDEHGQQYLVGMMVVVVDHLHKGLHSAALCQLLRVHLLRNLKPQTECTRAAKDII